MKTAVEWLEEKWNNYPLKIGKSNFRLFINQSKKMEKEQIKKLLEIIMWYDEESDIRIDIETYTWFMKLYNETFKSE